jgi:SAM-dependent methyltransferase
MSFYTQKHYSVKSAADFFEYRMLYLEALAENRPGKHLDIGCSIGNFVNLDPARIDGVDLDEDALAVCHERGLHCWRFNLETDSFPQSEVYQVVYMRHVIEHLKDPLAALVKIRGVMQAGALLIIETPDYVRAHHRSKSNFWDDYTHVRPFTHRALERISHDAGFEIARGGFKPHYGYWTKLAMRKGWMSPEFAYRWHIRLGLVRDDLLFVLKKPAT